MGRPPAPANDVAGDRLVHASGTGGQSEDATSTHTAARCAEQASSRRSFSSAAAIHERCPPRHLRLDVSTQRCRGPLQRLASVRKPLPRSKRSSAVTSVSSSTCAVAARKRSAGSSCSTRTERLRTATSRLSTVSREPGFRGHPRGSWERGGTRARTSAAHPPARCAFRAIEGSQRETSATGSTRGAPTPAALCCR